MPLADGTLQLRFTQVSYDLSHDSFMVNTFHKNDESHTHPMRKSSWGDVSRLTSTQWKTSLHLVLLHGGTTHSKRALAQVQL
jgi:hypothetical protein